MRIKLSCPAKKEGTDKLSFTTTFLFSKERYISYRTNQYSIFTSCLVTSDGISARL